MYLIIAYVHIVTAVFFTGYVLFWAVMAWHLGRLVDSSERDGYLALIALSRFPPAGVPVPIRISLIGLGWVLLMVLIATGIFLIWYGRPDSNLLSSSGAHLGREWFLLIAKLLLIAGGGACQFVLARRRSISAIYTLFVTVLTVNVLSALLIH